MIISQLAASLRQNPHLESAIDYISKYGEGELAEDFRKSSWNAWTGKISDSRKILSIIAKKWKEDSHGIYRSLMTMSSIFSEKNPEKRNKILDRSVDILLSDINLSFKKYINSLQIPTLMIFSFGIIMPLMLISLLPILSIFNLNSSLLLLTIFLFLSISLTHFYSQKIIKKRPVAFSEQKIIVDSPNKFFFVSLASLISIPSILYILNILGIKLSGFVLEIASFELSPLSLLWGIGISLSIYFYMISKSGKALRNKIKKLDSQFLDFLFNLNNHLLNSKPLEDAIKSSCLDDELSLFFKKSINLVERRSLSLKQALSYHKIESKLVRSSIEMILKSMERGSKASAETCSTLLNYFEKINQAQSELKLSLQKNINMMKATVILIGPLICSIIIVLFEVMSQNMSAMETPIMFSYIDSGILQILVGLYCISLNYTLINYSTSVMHGNDKVELASELYQSIPLSLTIFTISLIIMRMLT